MELKSQKTDAFHFCVQLFSRVLLVTISPYYPTSLLCWKTKRISDKEIYEFSNWFLLASAFSITVAFLRCLASSKMSREGRQISQWARTTQRAPWELWRVGIWSEHCSRGASPLSLLSPWPNSGCNCSSPRPYGSARRFSSSWKTWNEVTAGHGFTMSPRYLRKLLCFSGTKVGSKGGIR